MGRWVVGGGDDGKVGGGVGMNGRYSSLWLRVGVVGVVVCHGMVDGGCGVWWWLDGGEWGW